MENYILKSKMDLEAASTLLTKVLDSVKESVDVYNIYGQLVKSYKSLDFTIDKNNSLYIYKVTYTNGSTKTYKVL